MSQTLSPSTGWKEKTTPGDDARYAGYSKVFEEIQQRKSARYGTGRALHRKQHVAAHGTLEVLDGLPEFARHGLFENPGAHEVWVRISNGGLDKAKDAVPDIRGFSFKVFGVHGDSALGNGAAKSQDFLLINQEKFAFPDAQGFVGLVSAASHGNGALIRHLFKTLGVFGAPAFILRMARTVGRPFSGFATEKLFSAVPIACGPYAVRVRLVPDTGNGQPDPAARADLGADFRRRIASQALHWELQLQYFSNETDTPIEDASVDWPTPYTTVARLSLPPQDTQSAAGQAFDEKAEAGVFDPWQALTAHRPLGDVQRARKAVYFQSQKGRGAA